MPPFLLTHHHVAMPPVSLEDFTDYFLCKSFDVISNGQYHRHVMKCKDSGDAWAVQQARACQTVLSSVKNLQVAVNGIAKKPIPNLYQICKDVMTSAQPPIKIFTGYTTCNITNIPSNKCIELSRTSRVHVHPKLHTFFLWLWYCGKIDYIVRSIAKAWTEREGSEGRSLREACEAFDRHIRARIPKFHQLYVKGEAHVLESIRLYNQIHHLAEPVLSVSTEADATKKENGGS